MMCNPYPMVTLWRLTTLPAGFSQAMSLRKLTGRSQIAPSTLQPSCTAAPWSPNLHAVPSLPSLPPFPHILTPPPRAYPMLLIWDSHHFLVNDLHILGLKWQSWFSGLSKQWRHVMCFPNTLLSEGNPGPHRCHTLKTSCLSISWQYISVPDSWHRKRNPSWAATTPS